MLRCVNQLAFSHLGLRFYLLDLSLAPKTKSLWYEAIRSYEKEFWWDVCLFWINLSNISSISLPCSSWCSTNFHGDPPDEGRWVVTWRNQYRGHNWKTCYRPESWEGLFCSTLYSVCSSISMFWIVCNARSLLTRRKKKRQDRPIYHYQATKYNIASPESFRMDIREVRGHH